MAWDTIIQSGRIRGEKNEPTYKKLITMVVDALVFRLKQNKYSITDALTYIQPLIEHHNFKNAKTYYQVHINKLMQSNFTPALEAIRILDEGIKKLDLKNVL